MVLCGNCHAFGIELPRHVEEKWPFSRARVRKASWMPHSFRTTNQIDGTFKYILIGYLIIDHVSLLSKKDLASKSTNIR